jgi:phosphatidylglycerophosphatase A
MSKTRSDTVSFSRTFMTSGVTDRVALILSTWFGMGLAPIASGTFGTLGAVPLAIWVQHWGAFSRCAVVIGGIAVGIWAAGRAENRIGVEDPSQVVIDEVAGFLTAMAFLPPTWSALTLGFFLFRLFDIWKPFPARQMERLPGGLGIVMDDVVAGLYTILGARMILMVV